MMNQITCVSLKVHTLSKMYYNSQKSALDDPAADWHVRKTVHLNLCTCHQCLCAKVLNCAELNKTSGLSTIEELPKFSEKCLETWSITSEDVPDL